MKCREFEGIVIDLARGSGLGGPVLREAAAHAEACARCASRLGAEREVTGALRALAESTRDRGAPQRVEAALAAAFAAQVQQRRPVVRTAPRPAMKWWGVAAAVALAAVAVSVWLRAPGPVEAPVVADLTPAPVPVPPQVVPPAEPAKAQAVTVAAAPRKTRKREVTTRFYALRYADSSTDVANGPMVRVQVPRTTLVSFGLPIDQDRASEPIQADVVLDDTGLARAIRFVRPASN